MSRGGLPLLFKSNKIPTTKTGATGTMKTLRFRITYRDWKTLRQIVKGVRGETMANYMSRVTTRLYCRELEATGEPITER